MALVHKILSFLRYLSMGETGHIFFLMRLYLKKIDLGCESVGQLGLQPERSYWYSNSGNIDLVRAIRKLGISSSDSIFDIGCGKGGALLIFRRFPFNRVAGLDISEKIVETAKENLQKLNIKDVTVYCSDASEFDRFDDYNYFYIYQNRE